MRRRTLCAFPGSEPNVYTNLMRTWQTIIEQSKREYSLYCENLTTGAKVELRPHQVWDTASIIKIPILLYLLDQVDQQKLSLRQSIPVRRSHVGEGGSGILQFLHLGGSWKLYNLALLMMIESDNTAANVLIELLGKDAINRYCTQLGFAQTQLTMERLDFQDDYTIESHSVGRSTALEMARLLGQLKGQTILSDASTTVALRMLRRVRGVPVFLRHLPTRANNYYQSEITHSGSKPGTLFDDVSTTSILNDCGYYQTSNGDDVVFCMFSKGTDDSKHVLSIDSEVRMEFAEIAESIYRELAVKSEVNRK
jgi:beta-lactamase class A